MSFYCDDPTIRVKRQLLVGGILGLFGLLMSIGSLIAMIPVAYFFFSIPFGWPVMNRFLSHRFVANDALGLTINWCIQLTTAGFVGVFVAPADLYEFFANRKATHDAHEENVS